jgi:hypothetical protein
MTQREIDRAVAATTGESLTEIRHRGFGIANLANTRDDPEPVDRSPLVLDWDALYPIAPLRRRKR